MKCIICGNEIPENENECPTCISFIDTLNYLTLNHFDEFDLPKPLKIPGLITHIHEMLKMSYEEFHTNLDSLSKKGFELINQDKDKEGKNTAKNFFQFFIEFMTSPEARATYGRESVDNLGVEILNKFVESELDIIAEMNNQKIKEANELAKQIMHSKAAKLLKTQAEYLKKIGKEEISDQILTKSLDLLLDGLEFEEFFLFFNELSFDMKTKYLTRIFPKYFQKLQELGKSKDFEKIFDNSNRIYRNQMLYDQSKEITLLLIKVIKQEALRILETEGNLSGISKATTLEKRKNIEIKFNKIYKKIAEIYIELDDLHSAHIYNDKIEKADYKTEIHKKIETLEAEKSKIRSEKAKETRDGEEKNYRELHHQ